MHLRICSVLAALLCLVCQPPAATAELGGDDCHMPGTGPAGRIVIAPNGEIFNARMSGDYIEIYKSVDHGMTFTVWSTIGDDGSESTSYGSPTMLLVDGATDKLFVSYEYYYESAGGTIINAILVAQTDPYGASASWSSKTVASASENAFVAPTIATDAANYADYYLYVAWSRVDADGNDIWFARSTDKGATFETPYAIANATTSTRYFTIPRIAYGFGGFVHVVWWANDYEGSESCVMYRRATSRAPSSIYWAAGKYLTDPADGDGEYSADIVASSTDASVVVGYGEYESDGVFGHENVMLMSSTNYGSAFGAPNKFSRMSGVILEEGPSGFVAGVNDRNVYRAGLMWPTGPDLDGPWHFEPMLAEPTSYGVSIAYDPSQDNRWAIVGSYDADPSPGVNPPWPFFDAEWFSDPGYLVWSGDLPYGDSDVVIADLEGDGIQEILYTGPVGLLYAYDGNLQPKPGFPIDLGTSAGSSGTTGQIAVGDLEGDGDLEIFVGAIGDVFGFDHLGNPLRGWPLGLNTGLRYYVSLGTVSRYAPLDVVVVASNKTALYRADGTLREGFPVVHDAITFGGHQHPAAIGDVDADGDVEMVLSLLRSVMVLGPTGSIEVVPWADPSRYMYDPVSLGDVDLDGDLELAFTVDAEVHLVHHDGISYGPAWPWTEPHGFPLSPIAIANNWSTFEPELFFGTHGSGLQEQFAYMLGHQGTEPAGWPHSLGSDRQGVTPLVGSLDGVGTVAAYITSGGEAYAYRNLFTSVVGWPRDLGTTISDASAIADIDGDGLIELVVAGSMEVYETHSAGPAQRNRRWGMAYYDAERSSCAACTFDRVTSAPGVEPGMTRVRFEGGFPNPARGGSTLRYSLPGPAAVQIAIYDARGRLVDELLRAEQGAGDHDVFWRGRDHRGKAVATGTYYARLVARGPGVSETLTRKLTVMD